MVPKREDGVANVMSIYASLRRPLAFRLEAEKAEGS
jgi:hypothetical protein